MRVLSDWLVDAKIIDSLWAGLTTNIRVNRPVKSGYLNRHGKGNVNDIASTNTDKQIDG